MAQLLIGSARPRFRTSPPTRSPAGLQSEAFMSDVRQWRDLCHLASVERDPAKLEILFDEIRRLLEQGVDDADQDKTRFAFSSRYHN